MFCTDPPALTCGGQVKGSQRCMHACVQQILSDINEKCKTDLRRFGREFAGATRGCHSRAGGRIARDPLKSLLFPLELEHAPSLTVRSPHNVICREDRPDSPRLTPSATWWLFPTARSLVRVSHCTRMVTGISRTHM